MGLIMAEHKTFYSVTELAKLLKVTRPAIFDRINRGTLKAQKVGATYIIPKNEVERIKSEKR